MGSLLCFMARRPLTEIIVLGFDYFGDASTSLVIHLKSRKESVEVIEWNFLTVPQSEVWSNLHSINRTRNRLFQVSPRGTYSVVNTQFTRAASYSTNRTTVETRLRTNMR